MEVAIYIALIVFAWVVGVHNGWKAREVVAEKMLKQLAGNVEKAVEKAKENLVHITIEKHDEQFYVFQTATNKFLTQADTKEALEKNLLELFPGKRFVMSEENMKEIGFI